MAIVETREYPEQTGKVVAEITDNGYVRLRVEGVAGLSPTVLRQLADLADNARISVPTIEEHLGPDGKPT